MAVSTEELESLLSLRDSDEPTDVVTPLTVFSAIVVDVIDFQNSCVSEAATNALTAEKFYNIGLELWVGLFAVGTLVSVDTVLIGSTVLFLVVATTLSDSGSFFRRKLAVRSALLFTHILAFARETFTNVPKLGSRVLAELCEGLFLITVLT